MCGIGGVFAPRGEFPTEAALSMWAALEDRGSHATGFAFRWQSSDEALVWKDAVSPSEASASGVFEFETGNSHIQYALFHSRYTTQGSVKNNGNNHPVVHKNIVLTHNGVLRNDGQVFRSLKVRRLHEVDTEALNAALCYKNPEWMARNVQGSASIAWVDNDAPQRVNLFTNGSNPLVIGRTKSGAVVWASGLHHLADFDIDESFNAVPYKVYTLTESGGQVIIRSRFVSSRRAPPTVVNRYSHAAAWGSIDPLTWEDDEEEDDSEWGVVAGWEKQADGSWRRWRN